MGIGSSSGPYGNISSNRTGDPEIQQFSEEDGR